MKLSIITINYNGSRNTLNLLKSLQDQTDKDFEIIVVDNASEEADFDNLKQEIGRAILVKNDSNLGFSGGNNVGIRKAFENGADWLVLLNNDTWVESGFISTVKASLEAKEGLVGLPIVEDGQTAYAGKIEWLKAPSDLVHLYTHKATLVSNIYVIGACLCVEKSVFNMIGFLDEKYFLYFEDTDFSVRAKRAGLAITILEKPKVNHQVSATTKKLGSPMLLRYHYRNALYFNWKNGPWFIKLAVWPWSFWIIKKQVFKIIVRYKSNESRAILNGVFDLYRNKMGQIGQNQ